MTRVCTLVLLLAFLPIAIAQEQRPQSHLFTNVEPIHLIYQNTL